MILVGILAFAAGVAGTAYAIGGAFSARRPMDLVWAAAAPVAVVLAIVGLVTIVSPDFLR